MKAETKLALKRFALRWLRKLVDVADDRLHAAEVTLRNDLSRGTETGLVRGGGDVDPVAAQHAAPCDRIPRENFQRLHAAEVTLRNDLSVGGTTQADKPQLGEAVRDNRSLGIGSQRPSTETFIQWEARRSGVAPKVKKVRRAPHGPRRRSASDFDFQILRKREEFVQ